MKPSEILPTGAQVSVDALPDLHRVPNMPRSTPQVIARYVGFSSNLTNRMGQHRQGFNSVLRGSYKGQD